MATVTGSAGTPTGTVSFYDGGTCSAPGATLASSVHLNGSVQASVTTSALTAVASPHSILACYSGDVNYSTNAGTLSQTVKPAPLTVTAANANRSYGQANPAFTGTIVGIQNGDYITATYSTTATPSSPVGSWAIVPTLVDPGSKLGNYTVTINDGTLSITQSPLTIVANDKTRAYGAANPTFDVQYLGFVNGDTASSLGGTLSCTTTASSTSNTGSYAIRCSGQTSSNYTLQYVDGTLTITDPLTAIAVMPNTNPQIPIGQAQPFTAMGTFADPSQRQLAGAGGRAYPLANMLSTRSGATAAESGGKLYVIGGQANGGTAPSKLVEAYDPVANTWTAVAGLGTARWYAGAAAIAGKLYVVGGCANAVCSSNVATVEVYDPSATTPAWTTVSNTGLTPRNNVATGVIGGKLYVAGGYDNSGNPSNVLEVYDPASNTWSSLAAMPGILQPTGAAINGKFYVLGASSAFATYDPGSNSWTNLTGINAFGGGAAALNNILYVVVGQSVFAYNPTSNTWTTKNNLGTARSLPWPVTIGNLFYVAGDGAAGQISTLEGFAPDEVSWASSNTNQATVDQSGNATAMAPGTVQITATSLSTPAINGQAPLTVIQTATLSSVTLNPNSVLGGAPSQGTVTLSSPAPTGGVVVTLQSDTPSAAAVPASVTVLAGNTSANFAVTTSSVAVATNVHISGSYNGNMQGALTVNPASLISKAGWSVTADSQETSCYNGAAANAIDGNPSTMWVTQFCPGSVPGPHEIRINLGVSHWLSALQYLPRQDGCSYGWIKQYEIYVSSDGVNWGTPVATGIFNYGNLATGCPGAGVPAALQVNFTPVSGQYIRLRALSEITSNPWTTAAEINVIGQ